MTRSIQPATFKSLSPFGVSQNTSPFGVFHQHARPIVLPLETEAITFSHHQCSSINTPNDSHRQWPWRLFAFASDLGIVANMAHLPRLAWVGWLIALPYFGYGAGKQPNASALKEELFHQSVANLAFPAVFAKLGVLAGKALGRKWLPKVPVAIPSLTVGLATVAALIPLVGDPVTHHLQEKFFKHGTPKTE